MCCCSPRLVRPIAMLVTSTTEGIMLLFVSIETLPAYSIIRMGRNAGCGSVDAVVSHL